MSKIGYRYGSEWHLLQYLGYHRAELNRSIETEIPCAVIDWLDFPYSDVQDHRDGEWQGVDFLDDGEPAKREWSRFWPRTGNPPNWDAIGKIRVGQLDEWLLVEAKGHLGELAPPCKAKEEGGLEQIRRSLEKTKIAVGVPADRDWLKRYYQFANRLAVLYFLIEHGIRARLLHIYFLGDHHDGKRCPWSQQGWQESIGIMRAHLGLSGQSEIEKRAHELFLPVCHRDRCCPVSRSRHQPAPPE